MSARNNNFFQPVISTLGLAISVIVSVLPLFQNRVLNNFFINQNLTILSSFLSFIIGLAVIWQIIENYSFIQIFIGKFKDRGKGYPEYWTTLDQKKIVWILIIIAMILGTSFFYLGIELKNSQSSLFQSIQSLIYIIFFIILISVFSILFATTKQKFSWMEDRENFPSIIFETLEKNRLIKPYIEIYENRPMNADELQKEGIVGVFLARKIKIKTSMQGEEIIEFIASNDGKEIIKVLRRD